MLATMHAVRAGSWALISPWTAARGWLDPGDDAFVQPHSLSRSSPTLTSCQTALWTCASGGSRDASARQSSRRRTARAQRPCSPHDSIWLPTRVTRACHRYTYAIWRPRLRVFTIGVFFIVRCPRCDQCIRCLVTCRPLLAHASPRAYPPVAPPPLPPTPNPRPLQEIHAWIDSVLCECGTRYSTYTGGLLVFSYCFPVTMLALSFILWSPRLVGPLHGKFQLLTGAIVCVLAGGYLLPLTAFLRARPLVAPTLETALDAANTTDCFGVNGASLAGACNELFDDWWRRHLSASQHATDGALWHLATVATFLILFSTVSTGLGAGAIPLAIFIAFPTCLYVLYATAWMEHHHGYPLPLTSPALVLYLLSMVLTYVHGSSSRQQYIVRVYVQHERDRRVEQLQNEKERLDYERQFALHVAERGREGRTARSGVGAGSDGEAAGEERSGPPKRACGTYAPAEAGLEARANLATRHTGTEAGHADSRRMGTGDGDGKGCTDAAGASGCPMDKGGGLSTATTAVELEVAHLQAADRADGSPYPLSAADRHDDARDGSPPPSCVSRGLGLALGRPHGSVGSEHSLSCEPLSPELSSAAAPLAASGGALAGGAVPLAVNGGLLTGGAVALAGNGRLQAGGGGRRCRERGGCSSVASSEAELASSREVSAHERGCSIGCSSVASSEAELVSIVGRDEMETLSVACAGSGAAYAVGRGTACVRGAQRGAPVTARGCSARGFSALLLKRKDHPREASESTCGTGTGPAAAASSHPRQIMHPEAARAPTGVDLAVHSLGDVSASTAVTWRLPGGGTPKQAATAGWSALVGVRGAAQLLPPVPGYCGSHSGHSGSIISDSGQTDEPSHAGTSDAASSVASSTSWCGYPRPSRKTRIMCKAREWALSRTLQAIDADLSHAATTSNASQAPPALIVREPLPLPL